MAICKTCNTGYPEKRKEMGYTVCIECSTETRWSGVQIVHHKTGNETQIVKDPDVAAEFLAKSSRTGSGALKYMKRAYRKPNYSPPILPKKVKEEPIAFICTSSVVARRPMPLDFEGVGRRMMDALETIGGGAAFKIIDDAEKAYQLLPKQATQLKEIANKFKV
jgi:hypothetical protein